MATKFHFLSTGAIAAPTNPGFDAAWEQTGAATRLPMELAGRHSALTAQTVSGAITIPITTTQDILCYQFTSNEVFHPVRFGTDCLFRMVIRCAENATTNNAHLAYLLKAVSPDGGTSFGTLASNFATSTEYPLTASRATRILPTAGAGTALTALALNKAFRLVLEVGTRANAPTAAGSYTLSIGNSGASDHLFTAAVTTDLNAWFDLTYNLDALKLVNYQQAHCRGMSVNPALLR
jgi:hypothetical protein